MAEAANSENELYGIGRMLSILNENPDSEPEEVLRGVMRGINSFVDGAEQFDDITMLCFRYHGPVNEDGRSLPSAGRTRQSSPVKQSSLIDETKTE